MLETMDRSIPVGRQVMWRVSSRAIVLSQQGPHLGVVDSIGMRRGEGYLGLDIKGIQLELENEDGRLKQNEARQFAIDPAGVSVWVSRSVEASCSITAPQ